MILSAFGRAATLLREREQAIQERIDEQRKKDEEAAAAAEAGKAASDEGEEGDNANEED